MTASHPGLRWLLACVLLALPLAGLSCAPNGAGSSSTSAGASGAPSDDPHATIDGPGVELQRTGIGLTAHTLDFVGANGVALAGAKASDELYAGMTDGGTLHLFRRDLAAGKREYITDISDYFAGSLVSTPDGKYLAYCRQRDLKDVVDDPAVTYPPKLAVPFLYDVAHKQEQRLIDFGDKALRQWRSGTAQPFISPDGQTVYVMAYDTDRLLLHSLTVQWLSNEARLQQKDNKVGADERKQVQDADKAVITTDEMRHRMAQDGVTVDDANPLTEAVRAEMRKISADTELPHMALLICSGGQTKVLPLTPEEAHKADYHLIISAGNHTLIMGAQALDNQVFAPEALYSVDLQQGSLKSLGSFTGMSKILTLDQEQKNLLLCYNPVHNDKHEIVTETFLRRIPLDGSAPTESSLGGDYLGNVVDLDGDGAKFAGQDYNDHGLYLVDTASGKRQLVSSQIAALSGVFLTGDAKHLVYLDSGVTYAFDLSGDFQQSKDWVTEQYFAPYKADVDKFLQQAGFTVPDGLRWQWEEHNGLGGDEVSVQVSDPQKPDQAALLRYDVKQKQVVALWLPGGYIFPIASDLQGKDFDYYDAEKLARKLLDRVGWIPQDTRKLYQPGPNPLYDQKSDSYVITFRSGYQLPAAGSETVYNQEATLRISAKTGQLAEMTLVASPEIKDQPLAKQRKDLDFIARNADLGNGQQPQPIPLNGPAMVDTQNARLIVYRQSQQGLQGPIYKGSVSYRLCWEVDVVDKETHDLYFTYVIDTETGKIIGNLSYAPIAPVATKKAQ